MDTILPNEEVLIKSTSPKIWNERWRLAALGKDDLAKLGLAACIIGLVFVLFHVQGNTTDIRMFGRSTLLWLLYRWKETGDDFSHAWLIPFISAGLVWWKRRDIAAAPKSTSHTGLGVVVCVLLMHYMAAKAQQPRVSILALIGLLWGIPFYLWGWAVARILIFPCAYLIFCLPLNFIIDLTLPLKMVATTVAAFVFEGLGIAIDRVGPTLIAKNGTFHLNIAAACSGLRSLLALTTITAVYAYITQKTLLKKWILFLSAIPFAMIGNIGRIVTVGLVAQLFGQQFAAGFYHDYSGFIFFPISPLLMLGTDKLLNTDPKLLLERWGKSPEGLIKRP